MNKEIAKKWFKQSLHDLEMARRNISIEGYDTASFLAQQSVEKLLKSIFALLGKKIPRIHHLDELANRLGLSGDIMDHIIDLTADYTFSRYPDITENVPFEEYNLEIAKEKVKKAENIFNTLKAQYQDLDTI